MVTPLVPWPWTRSAQRGFTLLEILLVLALLGLAYALVPPFIAVGGSTTELKAAARKVAAGLRLARTQAILHGQETALHFDVEARQLYLDGEARRHSLPKAVRIEVFTAESEVSADTRMAAIRFYPNGSSTGGRVTLAMGEWAFMVDVDWLTGQVEVLDAP